MRLVRYIFLVWIFIWAIPSMGQKNKKDPTLEDVGKVLDTKAIRTHTNEVFVRMTGEIEETADGIFLLTEDIQVAQNALTWKINAVGAAEHAFFDNDPIVSLLDAYAFSIQQKEFFFSGAGKDIFGEEQAAVNDFSEVLYLELKALIEDICSEHGFECNVLTTINNWAQKYPIESLYFNRHSVIELMANLTGPFKRGLGKSVVEMTESLQDMSSRMNIYGQIMPKKMRWEMQLIIIQLEMKTLMDSSIAAMSHMKTMSTAMQDQMDSLQLVSMVQMDRIRENMTDAMTVERLEMQDWASSLSDSMTSLMLDQSTRWESIINKQRELAFEDANGMIESSTDPMNKMIDHAFWRGLQLLFVAVILFAIAYFIVKKIRSK